MPKQKKEEPIVEKTLDQKNILERHTINDKFHLGNALQDLDNKIKVLYEITHNQSVALEFLTAWFEENGKTAIQVQKPTIELLK